MSHTEETAEQAEIRAIAREFASSEIEPHARRWDEAGSLDQEVVAKLSELGFLGVRVPEEHGGLGLGWLAYLAVLEELGRADAAVALTVSIHNGVVVELIRAHGHGPQKRLWLPRLATGEVLGSCGSFGAKSEGDAPGPIVRASEDQRAWRLDGRVEWVGSGRRAGLVVVFAREEDSAGPDAACFLVDETAGSYRVSQRRQAIGLRACDPVDVILDDTATASQGLLGDAAMGARYLLEARDRARAGFGAVATGIGRAAFEHAVGYALERRQFGRPIAEFGAIKEKIAGMATRHAQAVAMVHAAGAALEEEDEAAEAPASARSAVTMAALTATEAAGWIAAEAVQIFGGYGYMKEYPVEKLLRDSRGIEAFSGSGENLRATLALEVLGAHSGA